jgi:hypothetical protein
MRGSRREYLLPVTDRLLEGKPSNYPDDVFITMFKDAEGRNSKSVPVEDIAKFCPKGFSRDQTLETLTFTRKAADKRVVHLTMDAPERSDEIRLHQLQLWPFITQSPTTFTNGLAAPSGANHNERSTERPRHSMGPPAKPRAKGRRLFGQIRTDEMFRTAQFCIRR